METFWEIVASNALLATVMAVLVALLGRVWKQPVVLHLLWILVLVKLFTPPVLNVGVPVATVAAETPVVQQAAEGEMPWRVTYAPPDESRALESASAPRPEIEASAVVPRPVPWSMFLAICWALGIVVVASRQAYGILGVWRILRSTEAASDGIRRTAQRIAGQLGLKRMPRISMVSVRISPMVWSLGWRVRMILPTELFEQMDRQGQESILAHELAHVRRRDHLVRLLELVATTVFWWHPVSWWASRRLRELGEPCCDAMVLHSMKGSARDYATSLVDTLDFVSETSPVVPLGTAGARSGDSLTRRIEMLKDVERFKVRVGWGRLLVLVVLLAIPMALAVGADQSSGKKKGRQREKARVTATDRAVEPVEETANSQPQPSDRRELRIYRFKEMGAANVFLPAVKALREGEELGDVSLHLRNVVQMDSFKGTLTVFASKEDHAKVADILRGQGVAFTEEVVGNDPPAPIRRYTATDGLGVSVPRAKPSAKPSAKRQTRVFRLNNSPAQDVAATLEDIYDLHGENTSAVRMSAEPVTNSIIFNAAQEFLDEVAEVIRELDQPNPMVRVEVLVGEVVEANKYDTGSEKPDFDLKALEEAASRGVAEELVAEMENLGLLKILCRPKLVTLHNEPALIEVGMHAAQGSGAGTTKKKEDPSVGATVMLTPRVSSDNRVVMEIDIEVSQHSETTSTLPAYLATPRDGTDVTKSSVVKTAVRTTVTIADGRSVVLGGWMGQSQREMFFVVTPHIIRPGTE